MHILMYFADGINLALFRPAYQSSTYLNLVASFAVDGITDNDISAHTLSDCNAWWKVHLAFPVWVTHVEITNRHNAGKEIVLVWKLPHCNLDTEQGMLKKFSNVGGAYFAKPKIIKIFSKMTSSISDCCVFLKSKSSWHFRKISCVSHSLWKDNT